MTGKGTSPTPGSTAGAAKTKVAKASGAGTQGKVKKPTKKRKPTPKGGTKTEQEAILKNAKEAAIDLEKQRALTVARRSDPLWFRMEDISKLEEASEMSSKKGILPEQVQIVESALAHNGLCRADVTPQAMACLLEQARRFAQELITDASDYSSQRAEITKADLMLAAELRADNRVSLTAQMPALSIVAQEVNRRPLPPIPSHCVSGVLLPSKEHRLTARTFDVVTSARLAQKQVQQFPEPPRRQITSEEATSPAPTYGATKGPQIPISIKERPPASSPMQVDNSSSQQSIANDAQRGPPNLQAQQPQSQQMQSSSTPGMPIGSVAPMQQGPGSSQPGP